MFINPVLQIEDGIQYGLFTRSIFGLNVFAANSVQVEAAQDPRSIFLQNISEHNLSSAHVGTLALEGDSPQDFFGLAEQVFLEVHVGIYGGTFYYSQERPIGCFFPEAAGIYRTMQFANLQYLISCDALSIYVEPSIVADDKVRDLLNQSIDRSEQWLQCITEIYSVVILSHADGWNFTAFSRDVAHFHLLDASIQQAKSAIETSTWYVQNKDRLRWDTSGGKYENCLLI